MPASTSNPLKRKATTTTFKPPRPKASATHTPNRRRKSAPSRRPTSSSDPDDDDNIDAAASEDESGAGIASSSSASASPSSDHQRSPSPGPSQSQSSDPPPTIPQPLLTKLIHHHLPDKNTRIGKDAMGVVGKYMETFVREAIARAAYERQEVLREKEGRGESVRAGDDFLEVEDLEKLTPQLLLDF